MGDMLDHAVINISLIYFIMSVLLTFISADGLDLGVSDNYGSESLDIEGSEPLTWDNVGDVLIWIGFFFKNAFIFFSISEAPPIFNIFFNIPRIWIYMWIIRLARGG